VEEFAIFVSPSEVKGKREGFFIAFKEKTK
jgi:hypothetical protein